MNSSPLFIIVAESTLILAPIDQLGCATACAGVAARSCSGLQPRSGPPLAVSVIRRTSAGSLPARHWKIALCSESTGSSVAPCRATAAVITSPAETSASLLASATIPPCSIAAIVGASPAQPTIAASVTSAPRAAASTSPAGPPAAAMPLPASASRSSGSRLSSDTTASSAPNSRASAASSRAWLLRGQRDHAPLAAVAPDQVERRSPDRAGRAEDGDRCACSRRHPRGDRARHQHHRDQPVDAVEHPAVARDQPRGSFTPARRLSQDSKKSPACATTASSAPSAIRRRCSAATG